MARVVWTEPALRQLEAIAEFIALDKPPAARSLVQRVFATTDRLQRFARLGRVVSEIPQGPFRQLWVEPCWVYYRVDPDCRLIVCVRRAESQFDAQNWPPS